MKSFPLWGLSRCVTWSVCTRTQRITRPGLAVRLIVGLCWINMMKALIVLTADCTTMAHDKQRRLIVLLYSLHWDVVGNWIKAEATQAHTHTGCEWSKGQTTWKAVQKLNLSACRIWDTKLIFCTWDVWCRTRKFLRNPCAFSWEFSTKSPKIPVYCRSACKGVRMA